MRDSRVLLVDDILTTGATCSEAAAVLKRLRRDGRGRRRAGPGRRDHHGTDRQWKHPSLPRTPKSAPPARHFRAAVLQGLATLFPPLLTVVIHRLGH